jgi:hypothetical protein
MFKKFCSLTTGISVRTAETPLAKAHRKRFAERYSFVRLTASQDLKHLSWAISFLFICLTGCRTTPLPAVNLQGPDWAVREGQAVWKRNRAAPELAGEILVATGPGGREFVQFTKTPFPMIIAQRTSNHWQIEIPIQNKRYSGPGSPPVRLIWLYLPGLLAGHTPPRNWSWQALPDNRWRLQNQRSGETLEGYLSAAAK